MGRGCVNSLDRSLDDPRPENKRLEKDLRPARYVRWPRPLSPALGAGTSGVSKEFRNVRLRACGLPNSVHEVGEDHLAQLTARQQAIVLDAVRTQLRCEPLRVTRNRKLRPNPFAPWELRVGFLRVFYEVDALESHLVNVLAIGIKKGNRLIISGKEIHI